jgi:hypothetical protein
VRYLYTSTCDIRNEYCTELIKLAKIFGLRELGKRIEDFAFSRLNDDNLNEVVDLYKLAHLCNSFDLKMRCIGYINKRSELVIQTASWQKLSKDYPELVLEKFVQKKR